MTGESFIFDFRMKWYYLEQWREVLAKANSSNQEVYSWKSIGIENWLEKGLSISDVLCIVILNKELPDYIDLPDDESDDE